jgi:hypothetical protein
MKVNCDNKKIINGILQSKLMKGRGLCSRDGKTLFKTLVPSYTFYMIFLYVYTVSELNSELFKIDYFVFEDPTILLEES